MEKDALALVESSHKPRHAFVIYFVKVSTSIVYCPNTDTTDKLCGQESTRNNRNRNQDRDTTGKTNFVRFPVTGLLLFHTNQSQHDES